MKYVVEDEGRIGGAATDVRGIGRSTLMSAIPRWSNAGRPEDTIDVPGPRCCIYQRYTSSDGEVPRDGRGIEDDGAVTGRRGPRAPCGVDRR